MIGLGRPMRLGESHPSGLIATPLAVPEPVRLIHREVPRLATHRMRMGVARPQSDVGGFPAKRAATSVISARKDAEAAGGAERAAGPYSGMASLYACSTRTRGRVEPDRPTVTEDGSVALAIPATPLDPCALPLVVPRRPWPRWYLGLRPAPRSSRRMRRAPFHRRR